MKDSPGENGRHFSFRDVLLVAAGALLAMAIVFAWARIRATEPAAPVAAEAGSSAEQAPTDELRVSPELVASAGIETALAVVRPASDRIQATGVVEPNQLQIQQVTPLVGGRIEQVAVGLGDHVQKGAGLATVTSPQIAEMQGNLRAAEARLAEAQATLTRTSRLVELGVGAGKDLVAARAEAETAEAQVIQLRESLEAVGGDAGDGSPRTSMIEIRAPMTGTILERNVNPGAWIEAGAALFRIADLRTVWVIVNVPEARLGVVRRGTSAEVRGPGLAASRNGRVSYIDPQIDATTRTARVRVEVPNPGESLRIGMFVQVTLQEIAERGSNELAVPSEAVQRIGERTVVFVATEEPGVYKIRDVEPGDETQELQIIRQGLSPGDRVVTKGGFTLKSQLLKGQFGEDENL